MSLPIGTRVVVTADKISHLRNSRYLGAVGTVVERPHVVAQPRGGENFVDWDLESFAEASASYWTDEALQVIGTSVAPSGLPAVGEDVNDPSTWNRLPLGTILVDGDGWRHTKIDDWDEETGPKNGQACSTYVDGDGATGTFGSPWHWGTTVLAYPFTTTTETQEVTVSDTPTRPRIDFGTESRKTAREYAADLVSRVNKPETNVVLRQVAKGEQVDAYALAEALLDAQRHVATRFGQSMQRRREGEKAAHLGYIAHAVLANHADSLPVYADSGVRSRKIEELEAEVADLRASVTRANETLAETAADLEREQVKHASTVENLVATDQAWHKALDDLARLRKIHAYAFGLLSDQDQAMVKGFEDGLNA